MGEPYNGCIMTRSLLTTPYRLLRPLSSLELDNLLLEIGERAENIQSKGSESKINISFQTLARKIARIRFAIAALVIVITSMYHGPPSGMPMTSRNSVRFLPFSLEEMELFQYNVSILADNLLHVAVVFCVCRGAFGEKKRALLAYCLLEVREEKEEKKRGIILFHSSLSPVPSLWIRAERGENEWFCCWNISTHNHLQFLFIILIIFKFGKAYIDGEYGV